MDFKNYLVPGKTGLLIGIGGVSMSPLAEVLHDAGLDIRGSDMAESSNTLTLRERGIPIHIGHSADNVTDDISFVIRTAAVHDDNPEVHEAHRRGIPVFERTQAWGALMRGYAYHDGGGKRPDRYDRRNASAAEGLPPRRQGQHNYHGIVRVL